MAFSVSATLGDLEPLLKSIAWVPDKMIGQWVERGMKRAVKILANQAEQFAPVLANAEKSPFLIPGLLKDSIGQKVVKYPGGKVVAIAGPRVGYRRKVGVVTRGPNKGQPIYQDPVNYAHLVERGTIRSAAQPFLRSALEAVRGECFAAVMDTISEELNAYVQTR